jgi:glycerophosphoryl diester phosphodiesterase
MEDMVADGVNIVAPPTWVLLTLDGENNIVPSEYAKQAKAAGLDIITWTLERSGPLAEGGGWYFEGISAAIDHDGAYMEVMDVLAQDVGIRGLFSDWPGTTTFYANCILGEGMKGDSAVQLGPRPYYLVEDMADTALKTQLQNCAEGPFSKTDFSIGHRGAPLQFPEHTKESYLAAARQGAGIIECDVTFTADEALVCRHSQCDLHTTTNILATDLAAKCSQPFVPADPATGTPATAQCCTSDITLAEFKTLQGKMDAHNPDASTVEEYLGGTPDFRTDLYTGKGTLMSHAESIALFKELGVKMTPELKSPSVVMPFNGTFTQEAYAQKMIDEYKAAAVPVGNVYPQSFNYFDIEYWLDNEPAFAMQAVYLDGRAYGETAEDQTLFPDFDPNVPATWEGRNMNDLVARGVNIVAPPLWVLVTTDGESILPSEYAKAAKTAGLDIITWSLERSGPLAEGGGWYYQSSGAPVIDRDGDTYELLDVLAQDIGIKALFSDWPATTTYYANCVGLK